MRSLISLSVIAMAACSGGTKSTPPAPTAPPVVTSPEPEAQPPPARDRNKLSSDLDLPTATEGTEPLPADQREVSVTQVEILVDGQAVIVLEGGQIPRRDPPGEGAMRDDLFAFRNALTGGYDLTTGAKKPRGAPGPLTLRVDRAHPVALVARVIGVAAEEGFTSFALAVDGEPRALAVELPQQRSATSDDVGPGAPRREAVVVAVHTNGVVLMSSGGTIAATPLGEQDLRTRITAAARSLADQKKLADHVVVMPGPTMSFQELIDLLVAAHAATNAIAPTHLRLSLGLR